MPVDEYDDLLDAFTPKRTSAPKQRSGLQPELESHWNSLQSELKQAGVRPVLRSGFRTAEQQNALHRSGKPTKGNDGYIKISPHQEGRALDIGNLGPKGQRIVSDYARRHGLHVPSDEPWHIAIPKNRVTRSAEPQDPYDELLGSFQGQIPPPEQTDTQTPLASATRTARPTSRATSVPVTTGRFGAPRDKGYSKPLRQPSRFAGVEAGAQGVPQPAPLSRAVTALPGVHQILNLLPEEDRENFAEGVTGAVAGTARQVANTQELGMRVTPYGYLGRKVLNRIGIEPQKLPQVIRRGGEQLEQAVTENAEQRPEPSTFTGQVRRGIGRGAGSASVELPKLILGGRALGAANLPVQGALSRADEGVPGILKGAAGGLVYHYGGQVTGKFLGKVGNSLVWIAGPTAERMVTDPEAKLGETIGENIPIGVFAGTGGARKRGQRTKQTVPETTQERLRQAEPVQVRDGETVRPATQEDLPRIVKRELEVVPPERIEDVRQEQTTDRTANPPSQAAEAKVPVPTETRPRDISVEPERDVHGVPVEQPQRFQHLQFGEVEVLPEQSGARAGRIKVAEVANPENIHYVKKADLQGRGNSRMIPIKTEGEVGKELAVQPVESPPAALLRNVDWERAKMDYGRGYNEVDYRAESWPIERVKQGEFPAESDVQPKLDALKKQIQEGTLRPILVHGETNSVINGNHRLKAYQQLGIKDVPVLVVKGEGTGKIEQPSSGRVGASPPETLTVEQSPRGETKTILKTETPIAVGATEGAGQGGVKPPAPLKPEPSITSARKEMFKADRAELDLPELPPAERKGWQKTLDEAKAKGTENAGIIADEVIAKPRALNDVETGQLVLRAQEVKNAHSQKMKEIGAETDPDVISAKRSEAEALEREFDKLTTATKKSGTEKGRALASQKLTINQDFDLVSVLQRAKAAKGRELKPEERAKFESAVKRVEELEAKLAKAEADALAKSIQKDIDRVRRQIKRGETKEVLDQEFVLLKTEFAQARMEAKGVQAAGLAGIDPEGKLTPIILKMARNRVKAGVVKAEDVVDHVYTAVREHVEGVSQDDIREILAGHNLDRDPLPAIKTRLRKREADLTRRLEERDFTPPPKRPKVVYDREASNLKAQVEGLKRKVEAEIKGNDSRIETALNMWKAGLLTGPRTHMRNIGGTAGFQAFEEVARVPGSIADLVVSGVRKATTGQGRRALSGPSPVAVARSSYEAATKGVREAAQIIRYGATAEELKIIDRPREANSGSKIIDTYINTVFRTLGAEDKIFRTYAYKRSIIEQAKLRAKSEGKSAKELEENPTAEMVSQGLLDAEVATFNNENVAAKGVTWAREHSGPAGKVAIDLVVPFKRTPANIMTRLLESTPLGLAKGAGQLVKAGVNKKFTFEDQRKFSQTIGRSVTGSSLIILGWKLAEAGLATGLYEEDRGDREVQKASGRSPMAVKIGNAWHQIGSFSPIGNLIAIGAALHREKNRPPKEGEDPPNLPSALIPIAARTMMEQPMLKGVSGVAEAIKEPGSRGATFIGRTLGSAIPTIVSDVGALTDDKRREARTIKDRIITRIPIARRSLPEDVDVFGRPMESRRTGVVDPTLSTTANDEPFIKELIRLDVGIVKTNRKQGEDEAKHREKVLTQGKEIAKELAKLTESAVYKAASDDDKREMIKDKVTQVRKAVNEFIETGGKRKPREPRGPRPTRYRYAQ